MNSPTYEAVPTTFDVLDDLDSLEPDIPLQNLNETRNLTVAIPIAKSSPSSASNSKTSSPLSSITLDGITQGRLIKLVGIPPNDVTRNQNELTSEVEEDSPYLKDVRNIQLPIKPPLGVDEKGRPIVDVIDSMDEDPFTLDSFEKMIRSHALKGKDYLLARIATVDPQDETRFYFSYYSAHHINKVLFRTQPEEGLLHRMKAKNPLNNMVIMGDVHYYSIKAISVNLALLTNRNSSPTTIDTESTTQDLSAWSEDQFLSFIAQRLATKVNRFLHGTKKLRIIMHPHEESSIEAVNSSKFEDEPINDTVLAQIEKFSDFLKGLSGESDIDYYNEFEILRERYNQDVKGTSTFSIARKVKSSSIVNDYGRTHEFLSFEEWLKETASFMKDTSQPTSQPSSPNEIRGSLTKLKSRKQQHIQWTSAKIRIESPVDETSGKLFYIAEYLATDDDFLMKSSIRTIFRENALEPDDAVLFTLPHSSDTNAEMGEQHPALRNFNYSVEANACAIVIKFLIPAEYVVVRFVFPFFPYLNGVF
ncbi:UNVERIFIED_CONTAM: hypothetical protein HDU68_001627 [Siphonaria sp. JEL0065]|nr:hypothetical protein HDU68_001627 [Siphonaria sp. JEL0065]